MFDFRQYPPAIQDIECIYPEVADYRRESDDRMKQIQHGHRPRVNTQIIQILKEHPNRWLTSSEIVKCMGTCVTRSVSRRLVIMKSDHPEIECCKDTATQKLYYRYSAEVNAEMNTDEYTGTNPESKMSNNPREKTMKQGSTNSVRTRNAVETKIMNREGDAS